MAEEAKTKGSAAVSSGDYETAIRHLTEASGNMDIAEEESPKHEPETEPMQVTEKEDEENGKRKKTEAMKEKEAGNASYKNKEFEDACLHYTKAMELDDEDISYITNRAAAYLEIGNFVECIKDCEKAVERGRELGADYRMIAKALTRKGTALVRMAKTSKDYKPAIEAFQKALAEHRNPDTLKKLNEAEKAKKDLEQQERMEGMDPLKVIQWKRLMDAFRADPSQLSPLKTFIDMCRKDASILNEPIFSFFRNYLESLDAELPSSAYGHGETKRVEYERARKREQSSSSGNEDYSKIMNDPELRAAFGDPEIMASLQNVSKSIDATFSGGGNQSNPKLASILAKMASKLGATK